MNDNMKTQEELIELQEEELKQVTGGEGKTEKTISITVYLPTNISDEYILSVYEDGVLLSGMTREIDPSVEQINLPFKGTKGSKQIRIKINNVTYKTYQINFDNQTYSEI